MRDEDDVLVVLGDEELDLLTMLVFEIVEEAVDETDLDGEPDIDDEGEDEAEDEAEDALEEEEDPMISVEIEISKYLQSFKIFN